VQPSLRSPHRWLEHARRLGLIVIAAVTAWGLAITLAAAVPNLRFAAAMRGRMSSIYSLVVTSGPRVGDIESGAVASLTTARFSMATGGIACIAGVGIIMLAFPQLAAFDLQRVEAQMAKATA
jgi:hypothetical protein